MAKPKQPSAPRAGECPHCGKRKPLLTRNLAQPVMRDHTYRPPGGKQQACPGNGYAPKSGTAR